MVRFVIVQGLEARAVSPTCMNRLRKFDNQILRIVADVNLQQMQTQHFTMSDMRANHDMPTLDTCINYRKARYFGHLMRCDKDYLPKMAICGQIFTNPVESAVDTFELSEYLGTTSTTVGFRKITSHLRHTILSNVLEWLTDDCRIPPEMLERVIKDKELYYKITRERYIQESINDLKNGHNTTSGLINRRRIFWCKKFGVMNLDLNSIDRLVHASTCYVCSALLSTGHLLGHYRATHESEFSLSVAAKSALRKQKSDQQSKQQRLETKALSTYANYFYRNMQPRKSAKYNKTARARNRFCCKICHLTYNTSIDSMVAHAEYHRAGLICRIYRSEYNNTDIYLNTTTTFEYKPEQHCISKDGKYHPPAGAELYKIKVPDSSNRKLEHIECRFCTRYRRTIYESGTDTFIKTASLNVACLNTHEIACGLSHNALT